MHNPPFLDNPIGDSHAPQNSYAQNSHSFAAFNCGFFSRNNRAYGKYVTSQFRQVGKNGLNIDQFYDYSNLE